MVAIGPSIRSRAGSSGWETGAGIWNIPGMRFVAATKSQKPGGDNPRLRPLRRAECSAQMRRLRQGRTRAPAPPGQAKPKSERGDDMGDARVLRKWAVR